MDRVAYKPLSSDSAAPVARELEKGHQDGGRYFGLRLNVTDQTEEDEDDEEEEEENEYDEDGYFYHHHQYWFWPRHCASPLSVKQLRGTLLTLAILLTLIFLAMLSLRDTSQNPRASPLDSSATDRQQQRRQQQSSTLARAAALQMPLEDNRPAPSHLLSSSAADISSAMSHGNAVNPGLQYYNYMSSLVGSRESNQLSADDLHYPPASLVPQLESSTSPTTNSTIWWALNLRSNHVTATDYIRANKSFSYNSSLTLTTQATVEFLYHTLELCKRWDGPISLAVYVPGKEFQVATTLIKYMRQCLPAPLSACIRDKVSWHFVYNRAHGPASDSLGYPKEHLDVKNFPLFVNQDQCPKLAGPNPEDLIRQFEKELRKRANLYPLNYRQQYKLTYPINVLRNTARLAAKSRYLLASDIELYPSINLVPSFLNFIGRHNISQEYDYIERFVFTLPIFEVKPTKSPPKTKRELIGLVQQGDAIFFHKWVCDACQAFPNRLDWLQSDSGQSDDEMTIFEITQRDKEKNQWEPIFIGTNADPLYDDRLSWDGRRDKMGQMFEMCLQNYHLLVVGNAFLVHAPGIKHIDRSDVAKRYNFMRDNNIIYDATMERLRKQYANSSNIDRC